MLDGNQYTDMPTKTLVEDIIREKCCIHLNQELPYIIRQVTDHRHYMLHTQPVCRYLLQCKICMLLYFVDL